MTVTRPPKMSSLSPKARDVSRVSFTAFLITLFIFCIHVFILWYYGDIEVPSTVRMAGAMGPEPNAALYQVGKG